MSQLVVRKIEEKVVRKLRERAVQDGVSMEEEHRRILRQALLHLNLPSVAFKDLLVSIPPASRDEPASLFARRRDLPRKVSL